MNVPALWFVASFGANLILLILFASFVLTRRGEDREAQSSAVEPTPASWETRIERLEVLWYPVVQYLPGQKKVIKTVPGVPHCKKCAAPLSLSKEGKGWVCPQCGDHFVESLVDVSILDIVAKQALKYFLERHKEYRAS